MRYLPFLFPLLLFSCQPEDITPAVAENDAPPTQGAIVLGQQKQNPYTVSTMQAAYDELARQGQALPDVKIQPTHWYIRFLPETYEELEMLYDDPELLLWDYPLDYEIATPGNYYHDPAIPAGKPTYQYTVVRPGYKHPSAEFEVLERLFLPDDLPEAQGRIASDILERLEVKAFEITGNPIDFAHGSGRSEGSRWRPSGYMRAREHLNGSSSTRLIPIKMVKVKAKRWFTLKSVYTNSFGYFQLPEFKGAVDYTLQFESQLAKVTDWSGVSRTYSGPQGSCNVWNKNFEHSEQDWGNATVFNAVMTGYYEALDYGLASPLPTTLYSNGEAVDKLNIRTKYEYGSARMNAVTWNELKVWTKAYSGDNKTTPRFYDEVFHELGHSQHYKHAPGNMTISGDLIRESWGEYFAWKLLEKQYPDVHDAVSINHQEEPIEFWVSYTPLFIDLEDAVNQAILNSGKEGTFVYDLVSGYSPKQIQDALFNSSKLDDIESHLRFKYFNGSESYLKTLIDFYRSI